MNRMLLLLIVSCPQPLLAEEPLTVELGQFLSTTSLRQPAPDALNVDRQGVGESLSVRYLFSEAFSAGLSYLNQGTAHAQLITETLSPTDYHQRVSEIAPILGRGWAFELSYQLYDEAKFNVNAEVGLFNWRNKIVSTFSQATLETRFKQDSVFYGLNANFPIGETWYFKLRARQYDMPKRVNEIGFLLGYKF